MSGVTGFRCRHGRFAGRRGFTLLMSVVALAIGVVVLTSIAGLSHNRLSQVRLSAAELQDRWGSHSCQQMLLRDAGRLLQQEEGERIGKAEREFRFELAGQRMFARLADENQKLDLNLMLRAKSVGEVERVVDQWSTTELRAGLSLLPEANRRSRTEDGLECWDQVWLLLPGYDTQEFVIGSRRVTLWGNRVHLFADDKLVRETVGKWVGPLAVERLLQARNEVAAGGASANGSVTIQDVVQRADLNERDRGIVTNLVTQRSVSYSLWLSLVEGSRTRSSLCVREGVPVGNEQVVERIHGFRW